MALPTTRAATQQMCVRQASKNAPLHLNTPKINGGKDTYAFLTLQGLEKKIPGSPEGETPIHLRKTQTFSHNISSIREDEPKV